jgi:hypothetical protein
VVPLGFGRASPHETINAMLPPKHFHLPAGQFAAASIPSLQRSGLIFSTNLEL